MPYSIQTKDGIQINNIPDSIDENSEELKQRVAKERALRDGAPIADSEPVQATVAEGQRESINVTGFTEPAASIVSGAVAEPISGITAMGAGFIDGESGSLSKTLKPISPLLGGVAEMGERIFSGADKGVEAQNAVSSALTYAPKTEEGQAGLESFSNNPIVKGLGELMQSAEKISGDAGFDLAGPIGAALASTVPTAISEALGLKGISKARKIANAGPDEASLEIINKGNETGTPVLTSDIAPPTSYMGKLTQSVSEKLGIFGSGRARAKQQEARIDIVKSLASEFEVELDSPFLEDVVKSLDEKTARTLGDAMESRSRAITALNEFGEVPIPKTVNAIKIEKAKQSRLKMVGNSALISRLEAFEESLTNRSFADAASVRTEIINDIKAVNADVDKRSSDALSNIKKAIDLDLNAFAKGNDKDAGLNWLRANRSLAETLAETKGTELKRILEKGEATPENVAPLLKGGKRSTLERLKSNLTPDGAAAARAAIIRDALDESGYFRDDFNPDKLTTALQKTNRQQAIRVFFEDGDRKQLQGLIRLLNATRRAQVASAKPDTGGQLVPAATFGSLGYGLSVDPFTAVFVGGTLSTIAKVYESRATRSLLLRLNKSKQGTPQEASILELIASISLGEPLAATEQRAEPQSQER